MRNKLFTLALGGALTFGLSGAAVAQDNAAPAPTSPEQDSAQGQPGRGPMRMDPDRQLEHMTRALGLSADQQDQIKPLLVERQQKMEALFQDQSAAGQNRHAKMQSIRQDTQSKIEAVLNDQQKQKFEAMQERGRRGGPPEGAPQPQL
jgi:periplasmic protein CpxP/Spy